MRVFRPVAAPMPRLLILALLPLVALSACRSSSRVEPDLTALYSRSAQHHLRNPVVVIPGLLGTRLVDPDTGQVVWGAFGGGAASAKTPEGLRLLALPLTEEGHKKILEKDPVHGVLDRIRAKILGLPLVLKAYANILQTLGAGGYRDESLALAGSVNWGHEHFTCFQFAYDWRHDNVENAQRLHRFLTEKKAYVQKQLEERFGIVDHPVKFDIVAHSMGGLISRYYMRYGAADLPEDGSLSSLTWAGGDLVERLVIIGTPNLGAAEAVVALAEGRRFAPTVAPYTPPLIGSYASSYQLLPRPRHGAVVWADTNEPIGDFYDPELWDRLHWGLTAPQADAFLAAVLPEETEARRREIAKDYQAKQLKRARQLAAALDLPAKPPAGIELMLVAGDAVDTAQTIAVHRETGSTEVVKLGAGDGSVLRTSALGDERPGQTWAPMATTPIAWSQVLFLFSDHLGLTKDPAFSDNVLYWLLEDPRASIMPMPKKANP